MNGYHGKILVANLTKGTLSDEPLNETYAREFLGSTGLAARYLFDMVDEKTDPLGPDNPLILMPGLLNGTTGPSVSRWGGATKSPYTGTMETPMPGHGSAQSLRTPDMTALY